jgi:hypothetical protein
MYSRWIVRSVQSSSTSLLVNRCLSFTPFRHATATKTKEKVANNADVPSTSDQKTASSTKDKVKSSSSSSTEQRQTISAPRSDAHDANKTYSEKIHRLVNDISNLSLIDVMDLNELLKVGPTTARLSLSFSLTGYI